MLIAVQEEDEEECETSQTMVLDSELLPVHMTSLVPIIVQSQLVIASINFFTEELMQTA